MSLQIYEKVFPGVIEEILTEGSFFSQGKRAGNLSIYWDTGSQMTCISKRLAEKLNLEYSGMKVPVTSINKDDQFGDVVVGNLSLGNNDINIHGARFCVLDADKLGADILIGIDIIALGTFHLKYSRESNATLFHFEFDPSIMVR